MTATGWTMAWLLSASLSFGQAAPPDAGTEHHEHAPASPSISLTLSAAGKPLSTDGQFKLVVSGEKRPARWVRNLSSLTVVNTE